MPITRTFTVAELEDLGVPPDSDDPDDWTEFIVADEFIARLKYSEHRRSVFHTGEENGRAWAVEYESGTGSEVDGEPENHGWYEDTVEAVAVRAVRGAATKWLPVEAAS